jgi:hypothetical protein
MRSKDYEDMFTVVLITPYGRWIWWPILGMIDFILKGKRRPERTIYIRSHKLDTLDSAIARAARAEINRLQGK